MDVYFLATRAPVPQECVDCQAPAILYQPEPKQLTLPTPAQALHNPKAPRSRIAGAVGLQQFLPFPETFFQ